MGDAVMLAEALQASRARTLRIVAAFQGERLLGPPLEIVNPPLWEIGHLGWFQEHWCLRHRAGRPLEASLFPGADALYDSSAVPHDTRWRLPLPSIERTHRYLAEVLERVLERLAREHGNESLRYFVRLATYHEDMHGEAFHYTCQTLGYPDPLPLEAPGTRESRDVELGGGKVLLGARPGDDPFVFDNEKWAHEVTLAPFTISSEPVTAGQFLAYVEAGGAPPRYWKRTGGEWLERRFDRWQPLNRDEPARHVDWHEANAYCAWAGRRLPSEGEFEAAVKSEAIHWGAVWEWTASAFKPYPEFVADPYKEYSEPWFGTHKVLRGASFTTPRRMLRPTFRNFYQPQRGDVFCGFRTCRIEP